MTTENKYRIKTHFPSFFLQNKQYTIDKHSQPKDTLSRWFWIIHSFSLPQWASNGDGNVPSFLESRVNHKDI